MWNTLFCKCDQMCVKNNIQACTYTQNTPITQISAQKRQLNTSFMSRDPIGAHWLASVPIRYTCDSNTLSTRAVTIVMTIVTDLIPASGAGIIVTSIIVMVTLILCLHGKMGRDNSHDYCHSLSTRWLLSHDNCHDDYSHRVDSP